MTQAQVEAPPPAPAGRRLRWWREVLYVAAFYAVYTMIRNYGVSSDSAADAFANARAVIRVERLIGLYHEETIQEVFLSHRWFIQLWNLFYGTFHFVITTGALVWCFRRRPDRYPRWRNTLACTTALALIGFALFPLMPPRLLPPSYGYVDTLAEIGGLWSFDSGAVKSISNQYAAMPSLHFGWALWSALVLAPLGEGRPLVRALLVAYPAATLFAIVVTANHFWIDAVGGAAVLAVGAVAGTALTAAADRRAGVQKIP